MKNLIENSISWNRLGRRSKSEYEFAIEKAVMSREDNTFEMDIKANFVMPFEDVLKVKAIILNEIPELNGVELHFRYENTVQTQEEILKLFVEHMIHIVN